MADSNMPPVRLHVRITNHGKIPVEVSVRDFDSDLGNFVVQPEFLALAPGKALETDPMTSRLGVTSAEIALKVTLVRNGVAETQILRLKVIPEKGPSGGPPPPPERRD